MNKVISITALLVFSAPLKTAEVYVCKWIGDNYICYSISNPDPKPDLNSLEVDPD